MALSHSPRPRTLPALVGVAGTICPSPRPQPRATDPRRKLPGLVPGLLSQKGRPQWGNHPSGRWHRTRSQAAEGPSALPHCPWGESENFDFWEVLVQTRAGPFCITPSRGLLGDRPNPTGPPPFLVRTGTLPLPDSWPLLLPAREPAQGPEGGGGASPPSHPPLLLP